jgi:hypothetical protein
MSPLPLLNPAWQNCSGSPLTQTCVLPPQLTYIPPPLLLPLLLPKPLLLPFPGGTTPPLLLPKPAPQALEQELCSQELRVKTHC